MSADTSNAPNMGGSKTSSNQNNNITRTIYNQSKPPLKSPIENLPNDVGVFLWDLMWYILAKSPSHLKQLYEQEFSRLTDQFFSSKPWPDIEVAQKFYEKNGTFHALIGALYSELTYRHLFTKCKESLTVEGREASWKNYADLFNYFNDKECKIRDDPSSSLVLTEQWYWDIHEEFVYQFQDTCQWKSGIAKRSHEDESDELASLQQLKDNREMWSAAHVFQSLHQIVISSEIHEYLKRPKPEGTRHTQTPMDVRSLLGYFSMISLMRMYTLSGEYSLAIETVQGIDISNSSYYIRIPSCHASFIYHLSFCYMMLKKYMDASRILTQFLISKDRSVSNASSRYTGQISKTIERMYTMLMLCDLLIPTLLDDSLVRVMKEKYSDRYSKLSSDNIELINEMFHFCQPKLINPAFSTFESKEDMILYEEIEKSKNEQPFRIFVKELQFQKRLNEIFSYASLYHNIQLSKLASFMDIKGPNPTEAMKAEILSIRHHSRQIVLTNGSLLSGNFGSISPSIEFYLEGDILHIKSTKTQKSLTNDFMNLSGQAQDLVAKIRNTSKSVVGVEAQ